MNRAISCSKKPDKFPEPIYTKKKKIELFAGMRLDGKGDNKLKKVGYDIIKFTYAVADDMLYWQERVKRVLY